MIPRAQLSKLVGIIAAMIVVVLLNVLAARRYTRWDWTSNKRYSLSPATVQTLRDLPETIEISNGGEQSGLGHRALP